MFLQFKLVWVCFCSAPGCIQVPNHLHVSSVRRHSELRVIKRLICYLMPKKVVELRKKGLQGGNWWDRSLLFLSYQKLHCRNQLLSQIMASIYGINTLRPMVGNFWYNFSAVKWTPPGCVILQHKAFSLLLFLPKSTPLVSVCTL